MRPAIISAALFLCVAACSAQPPVTEKLDDLDYHVESATGAGLSEYAGGAHIAYFLVWSVERGLVTPEHLDASVVGPVHEKAPGAFEAALDWFDGVASTGSLNDAGRVFAASCYESYADRYDEAFGARGYHEPNWTDYERSAAILDALRETGCA